MLKSIEVENYRSFAQPARLDIRPITVLLGRNSAGKSSLTRLIPLLRQSLSRETSAPILWTSTTVDFGRIGDVINRDAPTEPLRIGFELDTDQLSRTSTRHNPSSLASALSDRRIVFNSFLTPSEDGKTDYHSFTVSVDDDLVRITMKNGDFYRIFINDRRFDVKKYNFDVMTMASRIFPWVYFDREGSRSLERVPDTENAIKSLLGSFSPGAFSSKPERSIFANYLATGSRDSPIEIPFLSRRELPEFLSHLPSFIQGSLKDENKIDDLYDLIIISYLGLITSFINESLNPVFDSSSYLGPIRSSGSRFYREQELSVERIDERGENFATYVSSLAPSELKSFNKILSDTFNVEIRSHATVGHISLEIARTGSGQYDNLADVGFGFSQLLPLIAQIHSVNRRRYVPFDEHGRQQIIAIEQPELHLHPAFQANLADLFVAAVTGSNTQERRLNVILETHSEALVGRLGELVVQEKISVDDIAVHFIQKDDQTGHSTVQIEKFNPDGLIENWPVGFFSARS